MIEFKGLCKTFGKVNALDNINLHIGNKGVFAILGPNGSGKTTLIKCILGMVIPDQGSIFINNEDVINKWEYRDDINYLPQIADFPANLTVIELIEMVKDLRSKEADEKKLIQLFSLEPYLDKKLSVLSGGTKQKVNLTLAFMFESSVVILDEPSTGLDPLTIIQLKELIESKKKEGKTILITTHIMSLAEEISDKMVFLLDGKKYFEGTIDEIKKKTKKKSLEESIAKILKDN